MENDGVGEETYDTALMSLSWPTKVCIARPARMSQSLDVASHAPETKRFGLEGESETLCVVD